MPLPSGRNNVPYSVCATGAFPIPDPSCSLASLLQGVFDIYFFTQFMREQFHGSYCLRVFSSTDMDLQKQDRKLQYLKCQTGRKNKQANFRIRWGLGQLLSAQH